MSAFFDHLRADHIAFIEAQPLFFVASAPSGPDGHVNVSPKGYDSFRIIDDRTVAYLDLTGSGAETIAHLRDNGRMTVMFCSFGDKPLIMRLFGRGEPCYLGTPEFDALADRFPEMPGRRSIIRLDIDQVQTTCGYAVPHMELVGERSTLSDWADKKSDDQIEAYWAQKNRRSLDGLPALEETPLLAEPNDTVN